MCLPNSDRWYVAREFARVPIHLRSSVCLCVSAPDVISTLVTKNRNKQQRTVCPHICRHHFSCHYNYFFVCFLVDLICSPNSDLPLCWDTTFSEFHVRFGVCPCLYLLTFGVDTIVTKNRNKQRTVCPRICHHHFSCH